MDEDALTRFVAYAAELSDAIHAILTKRRLKPSDQASWRLAQAIAVKLYLIKSYITSLPPYWVGSDVQQLCHLLLQDFNIVTPSWTGSTSSSYLKVSLGRGETNLEQRLVNFFKTHVRTAQSMKRICDELYDKLTKHETDKESLPDLAAQNLETQDDLVSFDYGLFEAIELVTECDSSLHQMTGTMIADKPNSQTIRHTARMCLNAPKPRQQAISRSMNILVSAKDMRFWQEFYLMHMDSAIEDGVEPLTRAGFCRFLEEDMTARLFLYYAATGGLFRTPQSEPPQHVLQAGPGEPLSSVLRNYDLTPKDKVMLAYAIARSYWQYYDSELMRARWTSDTIWFMPKENTTGCENTLPLCAYLSFPFGISSNTTRELLHDELLNHRCPRIFDIGVLLLEIGLSKPFRSGIRRNWVAQMNLNHKIATDELLELEKSHWDGFKHKVHFDEAVKFCLNSKNFISLPKQSPTTQQTTRSPNMTDLDGIRTRKRIFRKNVVLPLAWIVKIGFRAQAGETTSVTKKRDLSPHEGLPKPDIQPWLDASFHSAIVPQMWLRDLKEAISKQVEQTRRRCRVTTPVRIAILDTGLNPELPVFQTKGGLLRSIVGNKDFVEPELAAMKDSFGHGTFMARLIMECAPGAEILVARVAKDTAELQNSLDNIKEAILWAGQSGRADIISMSFGLPRNDQNICDAIESVQKNREGKIIFLASAGNSSTDRESFPARHPSVLSVYAMDCHGTFLQSNAERPSKGAAVLGTYGDDIPDAICKEFSVAYPTVCRPGSSVATAVMAGISAIMLRYVPVLPSHQGTPATTSNRVRKHIWTTKGMEAVLYKLSQEDPGHPGCHAVKPMWFWKNKPDDDTRSWAIYDALAEVDGDFSKPPRMG